jgi:2,3-bisphosphoglycerate-dependent phosphoglycerate mutase
MKLNLLFRMWLAILVFTFAACQSNPSQKEAAMVGDTDAEAASSAMTVYLVRHAEKDMTDTTNQDPGLTPEGEARAEALRALLEGQEVDALYATKYIRTINTLKPLAESRQLEVRQYEAHDFDNLKEQLLQHHMGETVVVAAHSNTLLPIIEAFGAERPVPDIAETEYDYLFKLTVAPGGTATVETAEFGVTE